MTVIESLAWFEVGVGEHHLFSHQNGHSYKGRNEINKQEQHQGSPRCPSKLFQDSHSSHNSVSTTKVRELVIKLC
jgi:hypothetical protein